MPGAEGPMGALLRCLDNHLERLRRGPRRRAQDAAVTRSGMIPSTAWNPSMRARLLRGSAASAAASAGSMRCLVSVWPRTKPYMPSLVSSECREMQGLEILPPQLHLHELDFRLPAIAPEVPVEIEPATRLARIVDVTGGVAHSGKSRAETPCPPAGPESSSRTKSMSPRVPPAHPVDAGKDAHLDAGLHDMGALEYEARKPEAVLAHAPEADRIRPQRIRRPPPV